MKLMSQLIAALALLVSGGLWAKPVQAVDAQTTAKSGGTVWPFPSNPNNCACAFCSGKASIGKVADHTLL